VRTFRILFAAVLLCYFSFAQDKPAIRFVQITDAHVFDDGWRQNTDSSYKSVSDDWSSLHWAVEEINGMVSAGKPIDFVVYTGDLGLSNVELSKECGVAPTPVDVRGLPPIPKDWAVGKIAGELKTLSVNNFYFVAGNNDFSNEAVTDARRAGCFWGMVQTALSSMSSSIHIQELKPASAVSVNGFRLAGLNTGSFKEEGNYKDKCPAAGEGCPEVEVSSFHGLVKDSATDPILLFMHIPELVDPFREKSSWTVTDTVRAEWRTAACDHKVMGIFAGHFHDSDRHWYASNTSTRDLIVPGSECTARKTWVAPPLAIKNQIGKNPTARGLLYVRIFKGGDVRVMADWFGR